ncbi:MAG: hypothetical protein M1595_04575 [Candidatus Thermoplasmatota archaeon]|jgi:UDPglucose 6-dehydrogenase|nr:hypothetical protein [Candidatus Thermoplasmatota archaeon]
MKEKKDLLVGVIGLGSVGKALEHVLSFYYGCVGFDIDGRGREDDLFSTYINFVCVNTPSREDGRLDCSHVDEVLERLDKGSYDGIVAVKSTVSVGYMDDAKRRHPNLRLTYFPEFLREKSTLQWTVNPDRIVGAGEPNDVSIVMNIFSWAENAKRIITDFRTAEIGKLAHNAFIALKVTFTNEMERVSIEQHADPERVMEIVWTDRRIASSEHLRPYKGGYDGKCVPKDTSELIKVSRSQLLDVLPLINSEVLSRRSASQFQSEFHGEAENR